MTDKLERRAFLMGFAASLALLFAPFERFVERLRGLLGKVAEASDRTIREVSDAYEFRLGYYAQLVTKAPSWNAMVRF